jgi:cell division protein ZapA
MPDELIPVTLWIAERGYRIKIKKEDEAAIRLAVKLADERLAELRNSYAGKDTQDFLAMCLLMYATDQVTDPQQLNPVQQALVQEMEAKIDKALEA